MSFFRLSANSPWAGLLRSTRTRRDIARVMLGVPATVVRATGPRVRNFIRSLVEMLLLLLLEALPGEGVGGDGVSHRGVVVGGLGGDIEEALVGGRQDVAPLEFGHLREQLVSDFLVNTVTNKDLLSCLPE